MLTPDLPDLGRRAISPAITIASHAAEPMLEFLTDNSLDVGGGSDTLEARKDRPRFWIVLVSVGLEVDAFGIVSEQDRGDVVKQAAVPRSQLLTLKPDLFPVALRRQLSPNRVRAVYEAERSDGEAVDAARALARAVYSSSPSATMHSVSALDASDQWMPMNPPSTPTVTPLPARNPPLDML
jgi:hypothetical protein